MLLTEVVREPTSYLVVERPASSPPEKVDGVLVGHGRTYISPSVYELPRDRLSQHERKRKDVATTVEAELPGFDGSPDERPGGISARVPAVLEHVSYRKFKRDTLLDSLSSTGATSSRGTSSGLETKGLLELCDSVRCSLAEAKSLGPDSDKLILFLDAILADEARKIESIDFEVIHKTRLDKLVADILDSSNRPGTVPATFQVAISAAGALQRMWRIRFKEQYFKIDEMRYATLLTTGRLKDISFADMSVDGGTVTWTVADNSAALEDNPQFSAGTWWLNLPCAQRDGMVGSVAEKPTKGRYGVIALPLLTGREEVLKDDTVKYIWEGGPSDMHVSLISRVGSQLRILRGYRLESVLAPTAGIRYDGLYIIQQYGQKLDVDTEIYRLELILKRLGGQRAISSLRRLPRPSQLDD